MDVNEITDHAMIKLNKSFRSDASVNLIDQLMERARPYISNKSRERVLNRDLWDSCDATMDALIEKHSNYTWIQKLLKFPFVWIFLLLGLVLYLLEIDLSDPFETVFIIWFVLVAIKKSVGIIALFKMYDNMLAKAVTWTQRFDIGIVQTFLLSIMAYLLDIFVFKTQYVISIWFLILAVLNVSYIISQK